MSNQVYFRNASIEDLALLKKWDDQPHVREAVPDEYWEWETELPQTPTWREQLIAMVDQTPIGFVQIIDPHEEETQYWGPMEPGFRAIDIWIGEADFLGKGYGTQMMKQAIERSFAHDDVHTILIDPMAYNTKAHRFYQKLGFVFLEQRFFDDHDCHVYQLKRPQTDHTK